MKSCATNVPPQGSAYEGWRIMYAHSLTPGCVDPVQNMLHFPKKQP